MARIESKGKLALASTTEESALQLAGSSVVEHAEHNGNAPTIYHIYTEDLPNVADIVRDHVESAMWAHLAQVRGLLKIDKAVVVEILDVYQARYTVLRLAADIADTNRQDVVTVSWLSSHGYELVRVFGAE